MRETIPFYLAKFEKIISENNGLSVGTNVSMQEDGNLRIIFILQHHSFCLSVNPSKKTTQFIWNHYYFWGIYTTDIQRPKP